MTKPEIKVGQDLTITNLVVKDKQVVAAMQAAKEQDRDLAEYVTNAVEIGVKALLTASVGIGVETLITEVDQTNAAIKRGTADLTQSIKEQVESFSSPEGPLAKSFMSQLAGFGEVLESLTAGEDSPIRKALISQLDGMRKTLTEEFTRQNNHQKDAMAKLLNPDEATSPLRVLATQAESQNKIIIEAISRIQSTLDVQKGKAIEAERGHLKGNDYEADAMAVVKAIAIASNDEADGTGANPDATGSKKGDGVIGLREGLVVKAKIVAEAKDRKDMTRKYWLNEADAARKTRGAIGFLGLCKSVDKMPGGQRIMALDQTGQAIVMAFDPNQDDPELLALVYQVVKMHSLVVVSSGDAVNMAALSRYVQDSITSLLKFDDMSRLGKNVVRDSKKMLDLVDETRNDIQDNLRAIAREISGVSPIDVRALLQNRPEELDD